MTQFLKELVNANPGTSVVDIMAITGIVLVVAFAHGYGARNDGDNLAISPNPECSGKQLDIDEVVETV